MLQSREPAIHKGCRFTQHPLLTMSQLFQGLLPLLLLGVASLALGQKSPASSDPAQPPAQCDGMVAQEGSGRQLTIHRAGESPEDTAAADAPGELQITPETAGHLKLSIHTSASEKTADAQGQFCKRERPNQLPLNTAAPASRSKEANGAAPSHPRAPVALLIEPARSAPHSMIAQSSELPSPALDHPVSQAAESSRPPAVAPIVTAANAKITIRANGEPLSVVLEAVRAATGVTITMPSDGVSDPVFMNVGPTSVRDALVALVDGSRFNYMIFGSPTDAERVREVVLSVRSQPAAATATASTEESAGVQPTLYGGQGFRADADTDSIEPAIPNEPTQPAAIPSSVPAGINIQQMAAQQNKSPGQVLDELQKQQLEVLDQQAAAAAAAAQSQSPPQ